MKQPDHSARIQVFRGIRKVAWNPVFICQGGCLRPPGNHNDSDLSGLFRINFRKFGLRVICKTKMVGSRMKIMVVSARSDGQMYHKAARQRSKVDLYPSKAPFTGCFFYPLESKIKPLTPRGSSPSESGSYPSGHSYRSPKALIYLNPRLPFHMLLPSGTIHTREKSVSSVKKRRFITPVPSS